MIGITPVQARALRTIKELTTPEGVPPSYAELGAALGGLSAGSVHRILLCLQQRGAIAFQHNVARSIRIVGEMEGLEQRSTADLHALRDNINTILNKRVT